MARNSRKDPGETQRSIERPLAGMAGLAGFDDAILGTPRVDPPAVMTTRVGVRKAYKMLIGGAFVRSESGRYSQMPESSGAGRAPGGAVSMENFPLASRKDGRDAVVAARAAQAGWAGRTAYNRGQILYRLGEMLDARHTELIRSLERGGLPAKDAAREVEATIDRVIAYAGWSDKYQSLFSSLNPTAGPHFTFTVPEPMGVVAVVAPSRPALLGLAGVILPVIVAGNTCVVLASEVDPRTAITFCEALATSDLPGGVVNILTGRVSEVLPHLAKHMDIAALDLHDLDPALEKSVSEAAAVNVKRVRARGLDVEDWFDAASAESPRWIERFVEMKTIWHPAGM
jgi:acyl-CoA reductase-like NAD-dependent aldehyde dehydrogenase